MKITDLKKVLFIFFGLLIFSYAFFVVAEDSSESNLNVIEDTDQDGLSNGEEATYETDPNNPDTDEDGYSDGVEVQSGYNPLIPAPGDKIVAEEEKENIANNDENNLTEQISENLVQLVEEKEGESINSEDLNQLIEDTLGDQKEVSLQELPEVKEEEILVKEQDYDDLTEEEKLEQEKEDTLEYLTALAYIGASNSPQKISTQDDLKFMGQELLGEVSQLPGSFDEERFEEMSGKGLAVLEQVKEVEVPENMLDYHKKGLQIAEYAYSLKESASYNPEDPISMMLYVSQGQSLVNLVLGLSQESSSYLIDDLGIEEIPLEL